MRPKLDFIVVNYETVSLTKGACESILDFEGDGYDLGAIVVVDNGSSKRSFEELERQLSTIPSLKLVRSEENLGFGRGVNFGMAYTDSPWVVLLNSDARIKRFDPTFLNKFNSSDTVIIGGLMRYPNQRVQATIFKEHSPLRLLLSWVPLLGRWVRRAEIPKPDTHCKGVRAVSGGFMAISNAAWRALGGFDSRFFMYVEDVELCGRLIDEHGGRVFFSDLAEVVHLEAGGAEWCGERALMWSMASYVALLGKGRGTLSTAVFQIGLRGVFGLRAVCHLLLAIFSVDRNQIERAVAFFRCAISKVNREGGTALESGGKNKNGA